MRMGGKFLYERKFISCETSVTNDQREENGVVSAYTAAAT